MKPPKMPPMRPLAPMPAMPPIASRPKPPKEIAEGAATVAEELQAYTNEARERFAHDNAKMRADERRFRDVTDSEYWIALCFETRAQKEEFLRSFGLLDLGDKYVDGLAAAKRMGKPITSPRPAWREPKASSRWGRFAR